MSILAQLPASEPALDAAQLRAQGIAGIAVIELVSAAGEQPSSAPELVSSHALW